MSSSGKAAADGNRFLELTWMDIQDWVGAKIASRGKSYQRSGAVENLGITQGDELLAWVNGNVRYAAKVTFKRGKISSSCTCPYGSNCKHGVAVVIEYLESVKQKQNIPVVPKSDERIKRIKQHRTSWPEHGNDDWDNELYDSENGDEVEPSAQEALVNMIQSKSRSEHAALLIDMAGNHPEVGSELQVKLMPALKSTSVGTLVKTVSKQIDAAAGERGWQNHWQHSGFTPDYSKVQVGLQTLFDAGRFDEIIKLGKKLYAKGMEQAGESNDEGETIREICDALAIVYQALGKCSLANVDKMELAMNWEWTDEYWLADGQEQFWKKKFNKKEWSVLADRLLNRLQELHPVKRESLFHRNYQRDRLTDQIIKALACAGRQEEMLQLCIREAPLTSSYDRLVTMLRDLDKIAEAEQWIIKGIHATRDRFSGIASGLLKQLLEIHSAKWDWPFVAAIKAFEFFERPSIGVYAELKKVCEKAKVWNEIRPSIFLFLTTGARPKSTGPGWPLPDIGIARRESCTSSSRPFTTLLIEIALLENDLDEALRLYDQAQNQLKGSARFGFGHSLSEQIADAARDRYPDRAIAIWKNYAESHISRTSPAEYSLALGYLKKIAKAMKNTNREQEFEAYIMHIKEQNKRKIRLIEMLDSLLGKRIVDD